MLKVKSIIVFLLLLLLAPDSKSQGKVSGFYYDNFGSKLQLNEDSCFEYEFAFDTIHLWANGKWSLRNNIIYFTTIPVYDTVEVTNSKGFKKDSLVLSINNKPERTDLLNAIGAEVQKVNMGILVQFDTLFCSAGQGTIPFQRLYYRKGKLFLMKANGKLIRQKRRPEWTDEKKVPWFIKKRR